MFEPVSYLPKSRYHSQQPTPYIRILPREWGPLEGFRPGINCDQSEIFRNCNNYKQLKHSKNSVVLPLSTSMKCHESDHGQE